MCGPGKLLAERTNNKAAMVQITSPQQQPSQRMSERMAMSNFASSGNPLMSAAAFSEMVHSEAKGYSATLISTEQHNLHRKSMPFTD